MKSLISFMECVLNDMGTLCCTSTTQDLKKVESRVEHEGDSFLTITLPAFGKDLERSLSTGVVDPGAFPGFSRKGGLPRFLGGFLDQVFDRSTGRLLDVPSVDAIWAIRQLTLMFAKISLPCSDARRDGAIRQYITCEQEVIEHDERLRLDPDRADAFRRLSLILWGDVLAAADSDVYHDLVRPQHGPGATADRLSGNAKWTQPTWTDRLEEVFPHWVYLSSSELLSIESLGHVTFLEPEDELPVRVITVPKTLKAPRIIAVEPTCMQYMQQGLLKCFTEGFERDDILSELINGSSQIPNQEMARSGSLYGDLATLDLSEASDRVSNLHVELMLAAFPNLKAGVAACRSLKADVDGYGTIPLAKFASMGSALTFPVEAMVFMVIILLSIEQELNRKLTRKDLKALVGKVRVYGDDIIIPVDFVKIVVENLEAFGLKVNLSKSFWSGKFRESCGKEYYDGEDVSITRVRSVFPTQRSHVSEIVSTVSTRNQLYKAGLWQACRYLDDILEGLIPFPIVEDTSSVLGRASVFDYVAERTCPRLHAPLVRGAWVFSKLPASRLEGYGALLKCLSSESELPFADDKHLLRAGRAHTVNIKVGWAQPF